MHPSAGGPPVVVERLAELAAAYGWQARIITTALFCDDDGSDLAASLNDRIDAAVLPADRPRALGLSSKAERAIGDGVRDADIVHLHTLWHPLNTVARRACARHGRPYVLSPHGMLDPYSLGVKSLRKRIYLELREKRNISDASCLIFTTPLEEELARKSLPWLGAGRVIPLGADTPPSEARQGLADEFLSRFPVAHNRRRLIFLGRLHPKKGIERILDALPAVAEACPSVLLIVAGSGEASYLQSLSALVVRRGLGEHVLFTGMLHGPLKWGAYAASEMFLLPSHQENFAIAAAEAMHMGLPVILSDKVNLWPFVSEARGGIVLEDNAIAGGLGPAIEDLLADPGAALQMGERGQRFAEANFVWANTARLTTDLYLETLNAGEASARKFHGVERVPAAQLEI
jgi:glycosyltransferase involved in cell wall biosynthesis